jgi:hypothetical protein
MRGLAVESGIPRFARDDGGDDGGFFRDDGGVARDDGGFSGEDGGVARDNGA